MRTSLASERGESIPATRQPLPPGERAATKARMWPGHKVPHGSITRILELATVKISGFAQYEAYLVWLEPAPRLKLPGDAIATGTA